jgi:hypothetical protein
MTESSNATLFSLPKTCPLVDLVAYSNFEQASSVVLEPINEDHNLNEDEGSSVVDAMITLAKRGRNSKGKAPIFEANVGRSTRLKLINKGFKSSGYKDGNCLGCSSTPPTISQKVIRSLGASFYGINLDDLAPSKLKAIPAKKKAVKKKHVTPSSDNESDGDSAEQSSAMKKKSDNGSNVDLAAPSA